MCAGINLFDCPVFCSVSVSCVVSALDCAFIVRSLLLLWCFKEVSWRLNLRSFLPPKTSLTFTLLKQETEKKEAQHDDDNDDDIIIK